MTKEQLDNGKEKIETPGPVPVGKPDNVTTLDDLEKYKIAGDIGTLASSINRHIDKYEKGTLPKEYAFLTADTYDVDKKRTRGGYPEAVLLNFDKFKDLTPQEMCMNMIHADSNLFVITDLEDDLKKNIKKIEDEEASLVKQKSSGFKEGDSMIDGINERITKLTHKNEQLKKVLNGINKREIFEAMMKTPDMLMQERMDFFTQGEKSLIINYTDLISNLIDSKYSPENIRLIIQNSPDASIDKNLIQRLNAVGGMAEGLDTTFPNKFKG